MADGKPNTLPREYLELAGFKLRVGKFYDPNEFHNGPQMEIRIIRPIKDQEDTDLFESLVSKIKELLK